MKITTELLDRLEAGAKLRGGDGRFTETERLALINAARLQVMLDEVVALLGEGVVIYQIVHLRPDYNYEDRWSVRAGNSHDRTQDQDATGPTILKALVALRDALVAK